MPADWCPFCPTSGKVPPDYDVLLYPNDFPAFSLENPPFDPAGDLYKKTGARGICDVVLYHPNHNLLPSQLNVPHWRKVVDLWTARSCELAAHPDVAYVFVFENQGAAIGVTMPHPHGQIYGFPFVPPQPEIEHRNAESFYKRENACLYCRLLEREISEETRLVARNSTFTAYVPFAARWPTEVHIYSSRHFVTLAQMNDSEATDLAEMISIVRRKYDNLYGFPMPLMMILRQGPAKGEQPWFHFHVEFYPIQRSPAKLKYLAAVESGTWTFLNDTIAEEEAGKMRAAEPAA
jgi:UDPglucose--hexose-1-phosphate uridylyltransferase